MRFSALRISWLVVVASGCGDPLFSDLPDIEPATAGPIFSNFAVSPDVVADGGEVVLTFDSSADLEPGSAGNPNPVVTLDGRSMGCTVDGRAISCRYTVTSSLHSEGAKLFNINGVDTFGTATTDFDPGIGVVFDFTAPTLLLTVTPTVAGQGTNVSFAVTSDELLSAPPTINATFLDSPVSCTDDGTGLVFSCAGVISATAVPGATTATANASDIAGNSGISAASPITVLPGAGTIFSVAGTVTGLTGTGLVLQNNGGDDLAITTDGAFTFATPVIDGNPFDVTVLTQPSSPAQTCTISNGSGTIAGANITNITVSCADTLFTVDVTVNNLLGSGLVLQNSGGDDLMVTSAGVVSFATGLTDTTAYDVTVLTQPSSPNQICTVTDGMGSIAAANASVTVDCVTETYTISGNVTGLEGSGLQLRLNVVETLPIAADGAFSFTTPIDDGTLYVVSVTSQPTSPDQGCSVTNGSGNLAGANVTNVTVTCVTGQYTVGGNLTGLAAGTSLTIQNNGADDTTLSANGAFTLNSTVDDLSGYNVTISSPPTMPNQNCTLMNGTGTVSSANVTNISISCVTLQYTVGGTVDGLAVGNSVTVQINGGESEVVSGTGPQPFTFPTALDDGTAYTVLVTVQPTTPNQTCSVTNGMASIAGANVTNIAIDCVTNTYTVGGTVSGLEVGNSVTLQINGMDDEVVTDNVAYTFNTPLDDETAFTVTVSSQPTTPPQICTVTNGSNTLAGANITNVNVSCATQYTLGGTVSGLGADSVVLEDQVSSEQATVSANGAYTFPNPFPDSTSYNVVVLTQPAGRFCTVSNGTGTISTANVGNINVACQLDVSARYPTNGADWNDYVLNDGADTNSATDAACASPGTVTRYQGCLHGGERRQVFYDLTTDCTGITAADSEGAFEWACIQEGGGISLVSIGFQDDVFLSDLIDFTGGNWRTMSVTVSDGGGPLETTRTFAWWTNPIATANNSLAAATSGTIYTITSNTGTGTYVVNAPNVGLVVEPGIVRTLDGAASAPLVSWQTGGSFGWLEGAFNCANLAGDCISLAATGMFRGSGLDVVLSGTDAIDVTGNNHWLEFVSIATAGGAGLRLGGARNTAQWVRIADAQLGASLATTDGFNTLDHVIMTNLVTRGVELGGTRNTLVNAVIANVGTGSNLDHFGVYTLPTSHSNFAGNLTITNTADSFIEVDGASGRHLLTSIAAANSNSGEGMNWANATTANHTVVNVAMSHSAATGINELSATNTFIGTFKVGNSGGGTNCSGANISTTGNCDCTGCTIDETASLAASFVAILGGPDATNSSEDANGDALYAGIATADWLLFDNEMRGWGFDGGVAFPNVAHAMDCDATDTACTIWDWSRAAADTLINGLPAVTDGTAITHAWQTGSSTFVTNAVEVVGDYVGNDNGLCESNEICLYSPNFGGYQGHGTISEIATTDGTVTGYRLFQYDTNGR